MGSDLPNDDESRDGLRTLPKLFSCGVSCHLDSELLSVNGCRKSMSSSGWSSWSESPVKWYPSSVPEASLSSKDINWLGGCSSWAISSVSVPSDDPNWPQDVALASSVKVDSRLYSGRMAKPIFVGCSVPPRRDVIALLLPTFSKCSLTSLLERDIIVGEGRSIMKAGQVYSFQHQRLPTVVEL